MEFVKYFSYNIRNLSYDIFHENFRGTMEAYKYIVDVDEQGQITIPNIPKIKSSNVEIIILPLQSEDYADLINASESSIEFWNNPADEVWKNI